MHILSRYINLLHLYNTNAQVDQSIDIFITGAACISQRHGPTVQHCPGATEAGHLHPEGREE